MPEKKPAPAASERLKRITVAIDYTTSAGHLSKSKASTSSILAFGRITDKDEANKQAILSGLRDLYVLACLEGFPEEAAEMQGRVLDDLRAKGMVP